MSEQDRYETNAEKLLSKFPDSWSPSCRQVTEAVAAALRAQGREIERLRERVQRDGELIVNRSDEIERKAADIAQLKAQLGEAEKRGMERAATIAERYGSSYIAKHIRAATAQPGPSDGVFNEVRRL